MPSGHGIAADGPRGEHELRPAFKSHRFLYDLPSGRQDQLARN